MCGVKTVEIDWVKDDTGRWQMNQRPNSEKIYKADLVLLAMGFLGPERAAIDQLELKIDHRTNIDTKDYYTFTKNVFAAGGITLTILKKIGGFELFQNNYLFF